MKKLVNQSIWEVMSQNLSLIIQMEMKSSLTQELKLITTLNQILSKCFMIWLKLSKGIVM